MAGSTCIQRPIRRPQMIFCALNGVTNRSSSAPFSFSREKLLHAERAKAANRIGKNHGGVDWYSSYVALWKVKSSKSRAAMHQPHFVSRTLQEYCSSHPMGF